MWLNTTMQPPVVGMFSPPSHVRLVVANSAGFTTGTARLNAQPRGCCRSRTVTREGYSVRTSRRCPGRIDGMPVSYVVLLPVKPPGRGKSRLGDLPRDVLATAFATDTAIA